MSTPTTEKSSVAVRSSRWSRRISRMAFENSLYATSTAWPSCLPGHRSRRRRCDARLTAEGLAARGESPTAFGRRCIPSPPQRGCRVGDPGSGCVAPPSNIPDILGRRALPGVPSVAATLGAPAGRIAALGATPDFHHGLLAAWSIAFRRGGGLRAGFGRRVRLVEQHERRRHTGGRGGHVRLGFV